MQSNSTLQVAEPKGSAQPQQPTPTQPSAAQRLEQVRSRLRSVSRNIDSTEGRLLDFESADEMQRALSAALRELQELTITVAVLSRKEVRP